MNKKKTFLLQNQDVQIILDYISQTMQAFWAILQPTLTPNHGVLTNNCHKHQMNLFISKAINSFYHFSCLQLPSSKCYKEQRKEIMGVHWNQYALRDLIGILLTKSRCVANLSTLVNTSKHKDKVSSRQYSICILMRGLEVLKINDRGQGTIEVVKR